MKYCDVSEWEEYIVSTKGTRDKVVLLNPQADVKYFLKYSMDKLGRKYTTEYWSEIVASEIGSYLGFNMLEYNFAIRNGRAGCISKSMIDTDKEELIEGHSILTAYDGTYNPEDKESYSKYTFSFICNALKAYKADRFIPDFVRILIFDAIIGNSDRHQSNWGLIKTTNKIGFEIKDECTLSNIFVFLIRKILKRKLHIRMAPIYDSGCCLGREFDECQINDRLKDQNRFDSFVRKGQAEIRWDQSKKKISHYELLREIKYSNAGLNKFIEDEIKHLLEKCKKQDLVKIVQNIDSSLPDEIRIQCGLSDNRKNFIIKVLEMRIESLKQIINVS